MRTFIDESGSFAKSNVSALSVIGALTCPDQYLNSLQTGFEKLKEKWNLPGEPIGGKLSEDGVLQVIDLLLEHDTYFHVVVTDTSLVSDRDFLDLKQMHIDGLYRHLSPDHHESLRKEVEELAGFVSRFSFPGLIQFCLLTCLLDRTLRDMLLWYAAKAPHELGRFGWILDAKDVTHITKEERTWQLLVGAFLQNSTIHDPFVFLETLDYSHMKRFFVPLTGIELELLRKSDRRRHGLDVGTLVRDNIAFRTSSSDLGLQLAHIVTNTYRRVLVGNIDCNRVKALGKLMMKSRRFAAQIVAPAPRIGNLGNLSAEVEKRFLLLEEQAALRFRKS